MRNKYLLLLIEIVLLVGLPYYLITSQTAMLAARPLLMGLGGLYCLLQLFRARVNLATLGLTRHNFTPALRALALPSLLIILAIYLLLLLSSPATRLWLIGSDPLSISNFSARLAFYIFGSAPVQEFIFRGYLTWRIEKAGLTPIWLWSLSVGIFALLHLPFHSPIMTTVALTLAILYLDNFLRYRNLLAVTLSHAIVGAGLIMIRNIYLPYT